MTRCAISGSLVWAAGGGGQYQGIGGSLVEPDTQRAFETGNEQTHEVTSFEDLTSCRWKRRLAMRRGVVRSRRGMYGPV